MEPGSALDKAIALAIDSANLVPKPGDAKVQSAVSSIAISLAVIADVTLTKFERELEKKDNTPDEWQIYPGDRFKCYFDGPNYGYDFTAHRVGQNSITFFGLNGYEEIVIPRHDSKTHGQRSYYFAIVQRGSYAENDQGSDVKREVSDETPANL